MYSRKYLLANLITCHLLKIPFISRKLFAFMLKTRCEQLEKTFIRAGSSLQIKDLYVYFQFFFCMKLFESWCFNFPTKHAHIMFDEREQNYVVLNECIHCQRTRGNLTIKVTNNRLRVHIYLY